MNEQTPSSERSPIASAVITHEGKVLLVRRRVKEGNLSWQFPGGEVEQGESAGHAAVREVREEIGILVEESRIIGERVHPNTGRTMIYIECAMVEGEVAIVDDDELDNFAWASRGSLSAYVPYGFYGPVQDYLDAMLSE